MPSKEDRDMKKFMESANLDTPTYPMPMIPGGFLTLEDVPNRKELPPLPEKGRVSQLYLLVTDYPETYKYYLDELRKGSYYGPAAEELGIPYSTIQEWARKGRADLEKEYDTIYSRFVLDVRKAVAKAVSKAEQKVYKDNPLAYLSKGPGRSIFGNHWSEYGKNKQESIEEEVDTTFTQEPLQIENQEDSKTRTTVIEMDQQTTEEAKTILEDILRERPKPQNEESQGRI